MTTNRVVRKQLATVEDLALGVGTITQVRNGNSYTLSKLTLIMPVTSLGEMAALDTKLIQFAILDGVGYSWNGTTWVSHERDASTLSFTPYGDIEAITIQAAIQELQDEKEPADSTILKESDIGLTEGKLIVLDADDALPAVDGSKLLGLAAPVIPELPVAAEIFYPSGTPPTGWLEEDGSAISRATYVDLFAVLGETHGVGDGTTTFNLPDARGEFIRGWDNGRGIDTARVIGSSQVGTEISTAVFQAAYIYITNGEEFRAGNSISGAGVAGYIRTQNFYKTRPRNIARMLCIKY